MKCGEVRNLALAYLDSELDARASRVIDLHIGVCEGCRRIYETEDRFGSALTTSLKRMDASPTLWEMIEADILLYDRAEHPAPVEAPPPVRRRWFRLRRGGAFAAVLLLLAVAGALLWSAASERPLDLALATEHCHIAHVSKLADPEFTGIPREEDLALARGRLAPVAFRVMPADPEFTITGSRLCHLKDVPVAFMLGERRSISVSMIVMEETELNSFPEVRKRLNSGHAAACSTLGDYQFAARRLGGHIVCMIGELPRAELEALLVSATFR